MQPGIVLISDPRVTSTPVIDNGDPLVDLRGLARVRIDTRKSDVSNAWHLARRGLADRLAAAALALPDGLDLLIVEAYRSPARQLHYWNHYCAQLHDHYPDLSPELLYDLASRWVAPPDVAPHSTGGAVDLTLCDAAGVELGLPPALHPAVVVVGRRHPKPRECRHALCDLGQRFEHHCQILGMDAG